MWEVHQSNRKAVHMIAVRRAVVVVAMVSGVAVGDRVGGWKTVAAAVAAGRT